MGTNMTYRVALDNKSKQEKGAMAVTWMDAAGRQGIPSSFIINKQGKVAWIGHPMEMDEKLWGDILNDKYDLAKAAAEYQKANESQQQLQDLSMKLRAAVNGQNWDEANSVVDQMAKLQPDNSVSPQLMKMNLLLMQKKYEEAYKVAAALSDAHPEQAELQNMMAWTIAAQPGLDKRDLALAQKMAERANKATEGKVPSVLDTLARTQFMNGKKEEAIATQQKAVNLAEAEQATELKATLQSYKDGKLPDVTH
jgi:hypothetical protein